jgi:sorbitol/mannitol transport system substrate-binding protein
MHRLKLLLLAVLMIAVVSFGAFAGGQGEAKDVTLTIATVNNPDMQVMEKLSPKFTAETGIKLNWVVLPENELRQKVTEDIALGAGKFDIVTVGMIEVQNWKNYGWISSLEPFFSKMDSAEKAAYDVDDLIPAVTAGLKVNGELYALPFYSETSVVMYRKDLLAQKGITMPEEPTWDEIVKIAKQFHDPDNGFYGITLRGLPGWGQNMAVFPTIVNSFGGRFFDKNWKSTAGEPEFREALEFYKKTLDEVGEPGPTGVGFTEALTLMSQGNTAMWYDASVAAGLLANPKESKVAGKIALAKAPQNRKKNNGWLWSWNLALESASKNKEAAFKFLTWATSKDYIELVAKENGWASVPPGTRTSTYKNPNYQSAADFAALTLKGINGAAYDNPTLQPVPYKGVQFIQIPEWPQLGSEIAQVVASYLSGQVSTDEAIKQIENLSNKVAKEGGYQK